MKRPLAKLSAILMSFILLASCTADADTVSEITRHLRGLQEEKYNAIVTASFPDREVEFSLVYLFSAKGSDRVTITAPEELSGIAFSVSEDSSTLEFDGARLNLGDLDDNGFSPLSALPALVSVWRDGNFTETQKSKMFGEDAVLLIYDRPQNKISAQYRTWFATKDFAPLYAEIYSDGNRIIQCKFERIG